VVAQGDKCLPKKAIQHPCFFAGSSLEMLPGDVGTSFLAGGLDNDCLGNYSTKLINTMVIQVYVNTICQ